jgi:hypothetical protein
MVNIRQKLFSCIILFSLFLSGCGDLNKTQPKIDVAILMPLTGTNAEQGKRLASLIQLGLEDALQGHVKLMIYDCATEEIANTMMDKIIAKKTKIVLGPLYSNVTSSIIAKAEKNNITIITLSNNPILAANNTYVFGHAPMRQTERLMDYFLSKEFKDFILLLPKTRNSEMVGKLIQDIVMRGGGNPVHIEYYTDSTAEIAKVVENISPIVDKMNESSEGKPVIYIADDAKALEVILSSLKMHHLDEKAIISGDSRIDIAFTQPIKVVYTGSLNYKNYNLNIKAKEIMNISHLTFLDLLAYDLGRMTSQYIGYGLDHELFLTRLNSQDTYLGASGVIKFEDNIAKRKYDIIERDGEHYVTIDKAR